MSRILLATFGSLGDLHPYIAMGRALKERGHAVLLASSGDYEAAVSHAGLDFAAVPPRLDELGDRARMARRTFHPRLGTRRLLQEWVYPFLDAAHAALDQAAAGVDLIVGHPLTFAVPMVAQRRGVPWLSTVLAPMSFLSRHDPPRMALDVLCWAQRRGPWVYDLMMSGVRRNVWSWEAPLRGFRARHGLATDQIMVFEGQFSPHGTLALFDRVLAAPQPDWPVSTHLCGAALHDRFDGAADLTDAERFLAGGEPPLVFALGSAAVWMGQDYFKAAAEAAAGLGRRAVLLTGQPVQASLPPGIRAFDYLPYSSIFARAAVVVHQAGVGTLSQALRSGRPQLITPVGFDQYDNAARAAQLGVARVLPFQKVSARRLKQQLAQILADSGAAAAAAQAAGLVDGQGAQRAAQVIEEVLAGHVAGSVAENGPQVRPLGVA